jgi:hypothetical protein
MKAILVAGAGRRGAGGMREHGLQPRICRCCLATHRQQARPWAVTTLCNSEQHSVNIIVRRMTDERQIQQLACREKENYFPCIY